MSENMSTLAKPHPYGTKPSPWSVSASGFSVIASAVACLSALCAFGLLFNDAVADLIGFDWVGAIGLSSAIGQKKLIVLKGVLLLAGSAVAVFFLAAIRRRGWLIRSLVFALFLLHHGAIWLALERLASDPYRQLQRLRIVELPGVDGTKVFATSKWRSADIQSFRDWHEHVMDCYDEHDDYLARRWQVTEPDRLKTYFFLNLVSHGWAFGNQHHPDRPASIFSNEENGWRQPRPGPATIRDYLDANIACCNDYAYLLKFLLDREGIRNRLAAIPGHIFNEVYLDGGWHVVDATTNMVFDASWHSIQNEPSCQRDGIGVVLFPHPDMRPGKRYRSMTGHFRSFMLFSAAQRQRRGPIRHPELPEWFCRAVENH